MELSIQEWWGLLYMCPVQVTGTEVEKKKEWKKYMK